MKFRIPIFSRKAQKEPRPKPRVPEGQRIYAIGDIHGRADLLGQMFDMIVEDLRDSSVAAPTCVFLGDYVDRGSDSCGVLNLLTAREFPESFVSLRGNHESLMLSFLRDPHNGEVWRDNGGIETLHSYGIDVSQFRRGLDVEKVAEQFRSSLPPAHLEFLQRTQLSLSVGDYFFCHAGIRPGRTLEEQQERDLTWIRDEFLSSERDHGKVIVHGHTPVLEPEVRPNRINIDTGAYISGRLTALVLEGEGRRFLSTSSPGRSRISPSSQRIT